MAKKLGTAAVITSLLAVALGGGTASGGETRRGVFDLELSAKRAGAPTGLRFHVVYKNPGDPEAKPPAVTGAVFRLPRGLRINQSAVPLCEASDEEFRAQGRAACPAASRIGSGSLVAMTGFPGVDPVRGDVVAFNGPGEIIEVVFAEGTNLVAGMDRLTIEGRRLVAHPPATPGGPPDGRTAVHEIRLQIPRRVGRARKAYVTAPPRCRVGVWRSSARYRFADGGETVVTSRDGCRRTRRR